MEESREISVGHRLLIDGIADVPDFDVRQHGRRHLIVESLQLYGGVRIFVYSSSNALILQGQLLQELEIDAFAEAESEEGDPFLSVGVADVFLDTIEVGDTGSGLAVGEEDNQ